MKKFLLAFVLSIVVLVSTAQNNFYFNASNYGTWLSSGDACAGCGNAWITVTRSNYKNQYGYYEYSVWSSTNSFANNGAPCYSYLSDVSVMYKQNNAWFYPLNFFKFWIIVGEKQVIYTLYYPTSNADVYVGIGNIQPYY